MKGVIQILVHIMVILTSIERACDMSETKKVHLCSSVLYWYSAKYNSPGLDREVLIVCDDGDVLCGMLSERPVYVYKSGVRVKVSSEVQWGYQENDFEYWTQINNVMLWAHLPEGVSIIDKS